MPAKSWILLDFNRELRLLQQENDWFSFTQELGKDVNEGGDGSIEELEIISAYVYKDLRESSGNDSLFERIQSLNDNDNFDSNEDFEMDEYLNYASPIDGVSCKCLPSCSSIHYDAEISQTTLNSVRHNRRNYPDDGDEWVELKTLIIFLEILSSSDTSTHTWRFTLSRISSSSRNVSSSTTG